MRDRTFYTSMASLQLCDGYLLFKPSVVSLRFHSHRISHRLIPKASASPPPSSSSSSSSSSSLSFSRRELLYQSAAVSLSLSSVVGPVQEAKADEQLSEWERVFLPIDPGVVLLDIAFVPDEPSRGNNSFLFFNLPMSISKFQLLIHVRNVN